LIPALNPLSPLTTMFATLHARGQHCTVVVARDAAGIMLGWAAARSMVRMHRQHRRAHTLRRERHPTDTRAHVRHLPVVRELNCP
jgi:hypothetical protein